MLADRRICTGCGACAVSCPQTCIEMKTDVEGFRYPVIDKNACVFCRKCEKRCPVLTPPAVSRKTVAYAAKHKKDDVRLGSSSGGVFPALANSVIQRGGVVCGAGYSQSFGVEHKIITNPSEIHSLQGAKYAQSPSFLHFSAIQELLNSGRQVLFSGTPCQIAGLKSFLQKEYSNLVLVDVVCHGVPSPMVWEEYLAFRRKKDAAGAQIVSVNQRDKCSGWSKYSYSLHISYEDGRSYCSSQSCDAFMHGFTNNLYLRPSCAECHFKGRDRCSDITLADYWGIWDQHPDFDDNKGVSLVLVHTEKGAECWKQLEPLMDAVAVDCEEALKANPSVMASAVPHPDRAQFFSSLNKNNIEALISMLLLGKPNRKHLLKNAVKKLLRL